MTKGYRVGSEVKVRIEKSRFGTQGRNCAFRIMWGSVDIGVRDEESWFDAIKGSDNLTSAGAWYTLKTDNYEKKFQPSKWVELISSDTEFREHVEKIMDEEIIYRFSNRSGNATDFYEEPEDISIPVGKTKMKTLFTATLLLFATGCIAYAHPPTRAAHHHKLTFHNDTVQAWVWVPGHYTPTGSWQHAPLGASRGVQRHMLSRYPRTHIRYVDGRSRTLVHHPAATGTVAGTLTADKPQKEK